MIKLFIPREEKKRFQNIFTLLLRQNCELCIFPEGLKWRNAEAEGIIYKGAFAEYPFNYRRKIGAIKNDPKGLKKWLESWKDIVKEIDNGVLQATEIPIA